MNELASVYLKYAAKKSLKAEILSSEDGSCTLQFGGRGVWETFKNESGKHAVQRISATERGGRRHTSMISVAILPIFSLSLRPLDPADVVVTFASGSGPGGQARNTGNAACRMRHTPTGHIVFIDSRDASQNKRLALEILTARVHADASEAAAKEHNAQRAVQVGGGGRGDKVRTYNFLENRVTDHRLGKKTNQIKDVMKGNLDLIL